MKQLSSILIFFIFISGCSNKISSEEAITAFKYKVSYCLKKGKENKISFPTNSWFESLSFEDKKSVIGYIAIHNLHVCYHKEKSTLRETLIRENNKNTISIYEFDLKPTEDYLKDYENERLKNIDKNEILNIQKLVTSPFNLRAVLLENNLYPGNILPDH